MMSTAPDSSAALAAASSLKIVSTTSFEDRLASRASSSGWRSGRCAGRRRARRACRRRCRRASSRPCRCRRDRSTEMNCSRSVICRSGAGPLKFSRMVLRIDDGPVLHERHGGVDVLAASAGSAAFFRVAATASALNGAPLWNFTSLRSVSGHRGVVGRDLPGRGEARDRLAVRRVLEQAVVEVLDQREVDRRELLRIEVGRCRSRMATREAAALADRLRHAPAAA